MNRRQLLIGGTAAGAAIMMGSGAARASGVCASNFKNTLLYQPNDGVNGFIPNLATQSGLGFLWVWARSSTPCSSTRQGQQIISWNSPPTGSNNIDHALSLTFSWDGASGTRLQLVSSTAIGGVFRAWSPPLPFGDGSYHAYGIGWDIANNGILASVDGAPVTMTQQSGNKGNPLVNYAGKPVLIGGSSANKAGVRGTVSTPLIADLAEFYFVVPTSFIDPTASAVVAGFIDNQNELPIRNDSSGSSAISGITPHIFLTGGASRFVDNDAAASEWDFVLGPSAGSNPPYQMSVFAGTIVTALEDPWTFTGEN